MIPVAPLEMNWPDIKGLDQVESPGLLVDPARVTENIARMVELVGGDASRLQPHVKTHKMPDVIRLQKKAGIKKFKAATLSELEMVADAGASEVLLAYQPVGPNVDRFGRAINKFPNCKISAVVDDPSVVNRIDAELGDLVRPVRLFVDVDCGMARTGIALGKRLNSLRDQIERMPGVEFAGLQVYDGHIKSSSLAERQQKAEQIIEAVEQYREKFSIPAVIAGGSPTYGIWAKSTDWTCSPGTTLFWDAGYARAYPELGFAIAAALITRVVSKPGEDKLCLDLGHKAVGAENPLDRRVFFPELSGLTHVMQSEEHLVVRTDSADEYQPGDVLIGYPQHICPTVALHAYATVVENGAATKKKWQVTARNR